MSASESSQTAKEMFSLQTAIPFNFSSIVARMLRWPCRFLAKCEFDRFLRVHCRLKRNARIKPISRIALSQMAKSFLRLLRLWRREIAESVFHLVMTVFRFSMAPFRPLTLWTPRLTSISELFCNFVVRAACRNDLFADLNNCNDT